MNLNRKLFKKCKEVLLQYKSGGRMKKNEDMVNTDSILKIKKLYDNREF